MLKEIFLSFLPSSLSLFSHNHLSYPLPYLSIGLCCEGVLLVIKVFRSPRDLFLYFEEADGCVRIVSGPSGDSGVSSLCVNSLFEVRPRRAGGLAVCTD